jgi:hypothetical protein
MSSSKLTEHGLEGISGMDREQASQNESPNTDPVGLTLRR